MSCKVLAMVTLSHPVRVTVSVTVTVTVTVTVRVTVRVRPGHSPFPLILTLPLTN